MNDLPRGSARYFNQMFRNAVERGKAIIDHATEMIAADGYPPLTQPLTVKDLRAMPPDQAMQMLQAELQRTTKRDPTTGDMQPDRATMKLLADFMGTMTPQGQLNQPLSDYMKQGRNGGTGATA